jgi:hypothetical protein
MNLFHWLATLSQSASAPGQPFQAQWGYVLAVLLAPALIGLLAAGIILLLERTLGIRLSGGAI